MASIPPDEARPPAAEPHASSQPERTRRGLGPWLLRRLDAFISEPLRRAAPSELARYRVLAGANLLSFLLMSVNLLEFLLAPYPQVTKGPMVVVAVTSLGTLILLRRTASPNLPALFFCLSLSLGFVIGTLLFGDPFVSAHAVLALFPAFTVYLLGPRMGLAISLFLSATLGILRPFLLVHAHPGQVCVPSEMLWPMHLAGVVAVLGVWLLGTLHRTARDEIQQKLEHTLKTLRDSERKLSSLVQNTDDIVCSVDAEGRLLVANDAMRQTFARNFGREPVLGQPLFGQMDLRAAEFWAERFYKVLRGQRLKFEHELSMGGAPIMLETCLGPIPGEHGRPVGVTVFSRDITSRKQAEVRLGEMHRTLVDVSRQAGMAEVATGVLHNVGNTLNSINVSANLVTDGLRKLRVPRLVQTAELISQHAADLPSFLTSDPRGQQLPIYLQALSHRLGEEHEALVKEMHSLNDGVEHLKSIVSMQQKHARPTGAVEAVAVPQLIDEALRLNAASFEQLGILIERDYAQVPSLVLDRHKLMQILINLLSNAQHALKEGQQKDRRLRLRVRPAPDGQHLRIEVEDNGMGINPEHLPRLFSQGFTTKKTGHGFGLHLSALAATELKGRLSGASPGPGQGATFTLELPLASEELHP